MRNLKTFILLLGLAFSLLSGLSVHAAGPSIKYGQTVKGEITAGSPSVEYTFKAEANDVVVIRMKQDGTDSSVAPRLTLKNASGETIADSKDQISVFSVSLAGQLTDGGEYTLVASSSDDTSTGKFQLDLAKAKVLTPGTPEQDKSSSDTFAYYAYTTDSPFNVVYAKQDGDFSPAIVANRVVNYEMKGVAELSGEQVSGGSLGIKPIQKDLYIVSVGEGTFDINFSTVSASYTISITTAQ